MLNLHAIKCNKGYYLTDNTKYDGWHNPTFQTYIFDCGVPQPTFHKDWVFVETLPTKIQKEKYQTKINKRFELIDPKFLLLEIPTAIPYDEAGWIDSDDDFCWYDKYSKYSSMYKECWDMSEKEFEDILFDIVVVLEIQADFIEGPNKFKFPITIRPGWSDVKSEVSNDSVGHQLLDKIMFPTILLHETPASLTSKQVYDILRQYIKEHINPTYAKITSDYDFCFTVEKNLFLAKPYTYESETLKQNGKSYHPKQIKKKFVNTRAVKVFEMTHKESNYRGYTPIEGLIGNSEDDLAYKMQNLCEEITAMINEPLVECSHCNGRGVLLKEDKNG